MRLPLMFIILLAFPVLEIYVLVKLAAVYGWWLALYLLCAAGAGMMLIKEERLTVFGRLINSVQHGQHPMLALLASARKVLAGLLLIFPGVISDVLAVLLLLVPLPSGRWQAPANDDVIEGQWRRED